MENGGNPDLKCRPVSDYTHLRDSCSHIYTSQSDILCDNNNDQSYPRSSIHSQSNCNQQLTDESYSRSLEGGLSDCTATVAGQSENVYSQLEAEAAVVDGSGMGKFYVPESGSDGNFLSVFLYFIDENVS